MVLTEQSFSLIGVVGTKIANRYKFKIDFPHHHGVFYKGDRYLSIFYHFSFLAFRDLLDNYELECGEAEVVTPEEKKENVAFVDAIMETEVMQEAHKYLVSKGKSPKEVGQFKWQLYKMWFTMVRRTKGDR